MYSAIFKRMFDFLLSVAGIVISLPLWLAITLVIFLESGLPVFYYDERIGKNKKKYKHFKFRSMIKNAEQKTGPMWSLKCDPRITNVGRILRATAMDELPQLWNIARGDMSFVGPRPERTFFVEKFMQEIPGYEKRFSIKPGLTGLAQVYGRHDTPVAQKLNLDVEYIKKQSFILDVKLIIISFAITFNAGWERFEKKDTSKKKA